MTTELAGERASDACNDACALHAGVTEWFRNVCAMLYARWLFGVHTIMR